MMLQLLYDWKWIRMQVRNVVHLIRTHGVIIGTWNNGSVGVEQRHIETHACAIANKCIQGATDIRRDKFGEQSTGIEML